MWNPTVIRASVVLVLGACLFALGVWQKPSAPAPQGTSAGIGAHTAAVWPAGQQQWNAAGGAWTLEARGAIPMPANTLAAHASHLLAMPENHSAAITAFWFAGDRESAPNVQIAASQWNRASQTWSAPRFVANRHTMGQQLGYGLRRLGNPVAWLDAHGQMHLFVVATGWGGWAASRILHLRQSSVSNALDDLQFEPVRVLPLSWFWNLSYLVRNPPLALADGGMLLPVHFELGTKHASALQFDRNGDLVGMVRVSQLLDRLQPSLVMLSPRTWRAFMRVQRPAGKIAVAQTQDAGQHWQDLPDLLLDNPDAAIAGLGLTPHAKVLAYNPSTQGRTSLHLAASADGQAWHDVARLAQGAGDDEFSYPAMAWADGRLWVSYSVDRTHIEWQRFTPAPAAKLQEKPQ
jgi:predicted neuraminidase